MRHITIIASFAGLLLGCNKDDSCYYYPARNITHYAFNQTLVTARGVEVDSSGYEVDLEALDILTDELESCLRHELGDTKFRIDHKCINVKIARDYFVAPCTNDAQIFPCTLDDTICQSSVRGECAATPEFDPNTCYCRGTVQDGNIVVVAPDLAAYTHELIHVILEIPDPIPENLEQCAVGVACSY